MAKKDLSSLVNGIMGNDKPVQPTQPSGTSEVKRSVGRPKKDSKSEDVRTTLLCDKELLRKLKYIAVADDCLLKDIINNSFKNYIAQWESEKGIIKLP